MPPDVALPTGGEEGAEELAGAPGEVGTPPEDLLYNGSYVLQVVEPSLDLAESETEEAAAAAEAEELKALSVLEIQLWIELDDMLQAIRAVPSGREDEQPPSRSRTLPIPSQLLGLLPPPPEPAGWPDDFQLKRVSAKFGTLIESVDEGYPARKRAERLSWMIWSVIGDQKVGVNSFEGSPYQPLIEAESSAERLRMALLRLRELRNMLRKDKGGFSF